LWCWFYRLYWRRSPDTDTDSFANPSTNSFANPSTNSFANPGANSIAINCIHHYGNDHHHYANAQLYTYVSLCRMLFLE
jgi:hypothetical protein